MKHHYYLIANEEAGSGRAKIATARIREILEKKNFTYSLYTTTYPGHEKELAQELLPKLAPWTEPVEEFPLLIVLGGDGTLHGVVNVLPKEIPVGYIPCGSGNDFARGAGIQREAEKAFWQIVGAQKPQTLQVMRYHEKIQDEVGLAINNIGIGLDAAIVAATNDSATKKTLNKYKLGSLAYMVSMIKVLFTQKGFPILVELNGQQLAFEKAFLCTTTNHPYFGGGVPIAPVADPRKATLDLVIVEKIAWVKIFYLIFQLARKKHMQSKNFHHFQTSKIRIISTVPEYGQVDGEVMGQRSFDLSFTSEPRLFWF
ncbi:YegS//BmrU family lipid kinase [Enterococcus canis]|uniref:YegS BmrU family lipid kinase n=1 Tax=Enterococcus canis TaxID=214095 RepID=A0A1L8RGJ8_9ENTE|nr:diacylglycerol kinase family protein [Enterococcus canis]OJG18899.1 YegS//BmrU family lipid kinase [Enterococcus canis]